MYVQTFIAYFLFLNTSHLKRKHNEISETSKSSFMCRLEVEIIDESKLIQFKKDIKNLLDIILEMEIDKDIKIYVSLFSNRITTSNIIYLKPNYIFLTTLEHNSYECEKNNRLDCTKQINDSLFELIESYLTTKNIKPEDQKNDLTILKLINESDEQNEVINILSNPKEENIDQSNLIDCGKENFYYKNNKKNSELFLDTDRQRITDKKTYKHQCKVKEDEKVYSNYKSKNRLQITNTVSIYKDFVFILQNDILSNTSSCILTFKNSIDYFLIFIKDFNQLDITGLFNLVKKCTKNTIEIFEYHYNYIGKNKFIYLEQKSIKIQNHENLPNINKTSYNFMFESNSYSFNKNFFDVKTLDHIKILQKTDEILTYLKENLLVLNKLTINLHLNEEKNIKNSKHFKKISEILKNFLYLMINQKNGWKYIITSLNSACEDKKLYDFVINLSNKQNRKMKDIKSNAFRKAIFRTEKMSKDEKEIDYAYILHNFVVYHESCMFYIIVLSYNYDLKLEDTQTGYETCMDTINIILEFMDLLEYYNEKYFLNPSEQLITKKYLFDDFIEIKNKKRAELSLRSKDLVDLHN